MAAPLELNLDRGAPVTWSGQRTVILPSAPEGDVWLVGQGSPVRLSGRLAAPVARAIDGLRDVDEVVTAASQAGLSPLEAFAVLSRWTGLGYVEAIPASVSALRVTGMQGDAGALTAALSLAGMQVNDAATASYVVTDDYLHLSAPAGSGPQEGWIPVQLRGPRILVGPLLGGSGACVTCLRRRVSDRRSVEATVWELAGRDGPPLLPQSAQAAAIASAVVVADVTARGAGRTPALTDGHIVSVDVATLERRVHRLVPVPGCSECDPGGASLSASNADDSSGVVGDRGGGLRTVDPDVTWRRHSHLVSDLVGLIPEVTLQEPAELRVFHSGPNPVVRRDGSLSGLRESLRGSAGGKGTSEAASRAGALAEAIERRSMMWRGDEKVTRAALVDIEAAIHPNAIQLYSDRQLALADGQDVSEEAPRAGFHRVPRTFDVTTPRDWVTLTPLGSTAPVMVPASLAWLDHPDAQQGGVRGCSNGVAAGNTREEAILQGLLELVERDAVALWWYPRAIRPAFDLDASRDPRLASALAPLRQMEREVWVLDLTTDLGIPVAAAVSAEPGGRRLLHGFGAHLDPTLAVVRAVTEVAQMEAAAARPWFDEDEPSLEQRWIREVTTRTDPWLAPHGVSRIASDAWTRGGLDDAIADVVARLEGAGLAPYWLDLTRRDLELPVVRTVVPGLRHFWNRFAPGRLYDVPPRMGWVPDEYGEDDLNPRWVFI